MTSEKKKAHIAIRTFRPIDTIVIGKVIHVKAISPIRQCCPKIGTSTQYIQKITYAMHFAMHMGITIHIYQ